MPAGKKLNVMNGCGALGASLCTLIMLLPVIIGTAGASAAAACSMPGMCGSATGNPFLDPLSVLMSNNLVVQLLLIASLGLIFYGMRGVGILPLAMSTTGGALLYIGMFVLSMSVPVTIAASLTLGVSYGVAYLPSLIRGANRNSIGRTGAGHTIQIFSAGCKLCTDTAGIVEVGKCKDCQMEVLRVDDAKNNELLKKYDIGAVPSVVIDGRIKVVGKPTFSWYCGDDFYKMLEAGFPLRGK